MLYIYIYHISSLYTDLTALLYIELIEKNVFLVSTTKKNWAELSGQFAPTEHLKSLILGQNGGDNI